MRKTRRRTIFRNGARRTMHMDGAIFHDVLIRIVGKTQLIGMCLDPCKGDFDRLFKDITKFSSQLDTSRSRHICYLNEEDGALAASGIGDKPCNNTRTGMLLGNLFVKSLDSEYVLKILNRDLRVIRGKLVRIFGIGVLNSFRSAYRPN